MIASQENVLARTLREFFSDHLPRLRGLSPHTIHSYRDSFTLLLRFMTSKRSRPVAKLDLTDIEAEDVVAFLDYLEEERQNTVATRNVRLAALHAFFRYVAVNAPEQLSRSQRILQIPFKRAGQRSIEYLEYDEIEAVLSTVDRTTGDGATGLRIASHDVQHWCTGTGIARHSSRRPSTEQAVPGATFWQGPQRAAMPPLASDRSGASRPMCRESGRPSRTCPDLPQPSRATADSIRRSIHPRKVHRTRTRDCAHAKR